MSLHVHGLGHSHPPNEITNRFLESLDIGTSDAWITERVGIRSRRTTLPLDYIRETRNREPRGAAEAAEVPNAELGARAARLAVERAGIALADVGLVVAGGCAPSTVTPAEACHVARALDLDVPAFDVASACTSFFHGVWVLSGMRPERLPPYVLLVVPEAMTHTVDYDDRSTAVLWGDGAAAAVLSAVEAGPARIDESRIDSNPAGADKVVIPRLGHFRQEGRTVQMFAIRKISEMLDALRAELDEPALHFVGHQANLRVLESVCRRCEIPPERHHYNVDWYGNTGGASAASVLSMGWEKWQRGDTVAVAGVGAGLSWSSYCLRFDETPSPGAVS